MTLVDSAIDPRAAFRRLRDVGNLWIALLAIAVSLASGAIIQSPVVARTNANQLQAAFDSGRGANLSAEKRRATLEEALEPPLAAQLVNPAIYFVVVVVGVALEALIASIALAFAGGAMRFGKMFGAFANVAFWCIGLYYLASSIVIRIGFVTERADAAFPSLLTVANGLGDPFVRGVLASVNVFLIGAFVLHAFALRIIGDVRPMRSYYIAGFLMLLEVLGSGLLSKVSG
jgi:hypothetical protein